MSDRIAEIRERLEKATPGPWGVIREIDSTEYGDFAVHGVAPIAPLRWYSDDAPAHTIAEPVDRFEDAEFIAHAPDDIAFLLSRLSAVTDALDRDGLGSVIRDAFRTDGWVVPPSIGLTAADAVRRHVLGEEQN